MTITHYTIPTIAGLTR